MAEPTSNSRVRGPAGSLLAVDHPYYLADALGPNGATVYRVSFGLQRGEVAGTYEPWA
jgi:hypothetical protein